jgi:hypothetical protein
VAVSIVVEYNESTIAPAIDLSRKAVCPELLDVKKRFLANSASHKLKKFEGLMKVKLRKTIRSEQFVIY